MLKKLVRKTGILKHLVFDKSIKIGQQQIKIPAFLGLECNLTETWMIQLLENLLPLKEGTFIDVGVNLGQTLIKVKGLEPSRPYVGFEPNPSCVFYVKELIRRNLFQHCTLLPVGLFTEDKVLFLECISNTEVDSSASLIQDFRKDRKIYHKIPVPVFQLQSLVDNIQDFAEPGLIKIDVEGAELEVIKSIEGLLRDRRPIVLLEVLPAYSADNHVRLSRQQALEDIFSKQSYSWFRVSKSGNEFSGLQKIESIGIHSNLDECDYVVLPDELADEVNAMTV